jgi:hypothetical protein
VLAEQGPYGIGLRSFSATDASRPDRPISITVWYPAKLAEGEASPYGVIDAPPDPSGAPYPLMLSSTKLARTFAPTLVSHGFTWASIDGIDTYDTTNPEMLHQPLDILFALDQVAASPPQGLEGMFAAENAGAIGYSFDGYNALLLSGARIDPQHYLELCQDPEQTKNSIDYWFEDWYNCGLAGQWDSFTAEAGEELTTSEDGLWQPVTDPRIKAVMPLAADGYYLFGDKGLAAVKVPAMFIAGENDDLYAENVLIYQHLGTPPEDKVFLTVLDRDHVSVIVEPATVQRLRHFANAFFGYYLQDKEDYSDYFSEEFVNQQEHILWGLNGSATSLAPERAESNIMLTYKNKQCIYEGPEVLPNGATTVIMNMQELDKYQLANAAVFFTLDPGYDLQDLVDAIWMPSPPEWAHEVFKREAYPGEVTEFDFTIDGGPLYYVCLSGESEESSKLVGKGGPLEVSP